MMTQGMVIYLMLNTENLSSIPETHIWNNIQVCPLTSVSCQFVHLTNRIMQTHRYTDINKEVHGKTV